MKKNFIYVRRCKICNIILFEEVCPKCYNLTHISTKHYYGLKK